MKTLLVLSALTCVAIAAPALQENEWNPDVPVDVNPMNLDTEINAPVASARSHLGLKSPIIVKKKTGYHLYRDSTEERANADPSENCSKHLRVKLCDKTAAAKSSDLARSAKTEDMDDHNDDVEHSIKIAKEAVESLQQDLDNIEHGASAKNAQWKHGESDKNIHEDISVANHALDNAQKSFGKLESMSLRATTLKDTEELQNHMQKAKTQEERYAQWKEAMETIQKNVEIARNIENSFRSEPDFTEVEAIDTSKLMRMNEQEHKENIHNLSTKENTKVLRESRKTENTNLKTLEKKSEHPITSNQRTHESSSDDMKSDASEFKDVKLEQHHLATEGKLADLSLNIPSQSMDKKHDGNVETAKGKGIKLDVSLRASQPGAKELPHATSLKTAQVESVNHKEESSPRTSESAQQMSTHKEESSHNLNIDTMHTSESIKHDSVIGKSVAKEWEADKHLKHEKSAWSETENKEIMLKAAENKNLASDFDTKKDTSHSWSTKTKLKSAEHVLEKNKQFENDVNKPGLALHSGMKLADNTELTSDITLKNPLNLNLDKGANLNLEHSTHEKSAGEVHMDQLRHAHGLSHAHAEAHAHAHAHTHGHELGHMHGHELGHMHGQEMGHMHGHDLGHMHGIGIGHQVHGGHKLIKDHHMGGYHGKSAEIDSVMHPSMQLNMREFDEKAALENMLQWKHHDTARSYGAGLGGSYGGGLGLSSGGSGSAVGVFPNAKVGGCAIPLLLSCSPSLVSGSLKSHGYAAPSYRHEEEFKFKNKRDIIKANDIAGTKIRHSTKTTQPKNLEKKL